MLGKMEMRTPPGSRPRDGRHCDLCGCSQPAVRCDKCGCQIFCLSCDDMYHRHPKRRFHLRKAVDTAPPVAQARPVLPVKVAHLNTMSPGDPSKMPLPPPRKKKSIFGSFRRPSPSSDNSPPLPKKEYSWTDRLGSIKKFMSNRPLPPLPNPEDQDEEMHPTTNGQTNTRGDLSFIHKRSEERPPQLPARSPRPQDSPEVNQDRDPRIPNAQAHMASQVRNGVMEPNTNHMSPSEENQWNTMMPNHNGPQAFGTMSHPNHRGFMPPGGPGYIGSMHQSSSATDLHKLHNAEAMAGAGTQPPHFPHYPVNPHMPPHYPYPMYPQYPNYPQYFGNSFANLSNPPTTDGDFSDQSESTNRHSSKKHPFRKRAKRSQSVMMDRMAYQGQFFPFGPYPPGYGPWGAPMQMEAPPSPASSIRSLNRAGRTRRRKKMTSEEDDEEFSVSSSPLSRPKSSSSERPSKDTQRAPLATQTTSSEEESEDDADRRRNKVNTIQRRTSEPIKTPSSPAMERKKPPKMKKRSSSKQSDSEPQEISQEIPQVHSERRSSKDSNTDQPAQQQTSSSPASSPTWECKHCTFINPINNKICQVCCKTAIPRTETPLSANSRPSSSAAESNRKQSVGSEKGCSSPDKVPENEDDSTKKDKHDMAILNSALDEAEKEISRGLEELMKLKDDMDISTPQEKSTSSSKDIKAESSENKKPVYKSSGRMRTSILDKLNINKPQSSKSSASTSTEVQTGHSIQTTDKIIEARRHSNSSTASETYNSPLAQSPELENGFSKQKRDSSCQTQQDSLADFLERKKAAEESYLGRPVNNFGFGYNDRMDMVTSPVPPMYDRYLGGGGFGMMQRSHSRASLFSGRLNDLGPVDYGGPGFGYGGMPMYRSVSRGSLTGDYPDGRMSEFSNLRRPDYYLSMEELVERRRQDNIRAQGLELVRMIREAEQQGFTADDIQVALTHCGKQSPMDWLQDNWRNMVDSVVTLSTNYGNDKKENDIGLLSENEARDALRLHKGNIWAAVTECVEGRQRKYLELSARGKFSRKDIVDALTSSDGDVEMAYAKLSKSTEKPFLMRIWGAGEGAQNQDGAQPVADDTIDLPHQYHKDDIANSDYLSDDLWSEDGAEVDWEEEEDYENEKGDLEDLQTCHEDLLTSPQEFNTPESEKSDYCDAFALDNRNMSSPSDDIFFVIPEAKQEKKKGFLSKLAALRKNSKEKVDEMSALSAEDVALEPVSQSKSDATSLSSNSSTEQDKGNGALNALKNTFSAIKDTVTGGSKVDRKIPCTQPEKRTIIVKGQLDQSSLTSEIEDMKNTSIKPLSDMRTTEENSLNEDNYVDMSTNELSKAEKAGDELKKEDGVKEQQDIRKDKIAELKPDQNISDNSLKEIESKINTAIKKPPSLAEKLKLAKQTYSSKNNSSSSSVSDENSLPSTSKQSSDTFTLQDKPSSKDITQGKGIQHKFLNSDQISNEVSPAIDRKEEKKKSEVSFFDSNKTSQTINQEEKIDQYESQISDQISNEVKSAVERKEEKNKSQVSLSNTNKMNQSVNQEENKSQHKSQSSCEASATSEKKEDKNKSEASNLISNKVNQKINEKNLLLENTSLIEKHNTDVPITFQNIPPAGEKHNSSKIPENLSTERQEKSETKSSENIVKNLTSEQLDKLEKQSTALHKNKLNKSITLTNISSDKIENNIKFENNIASAVVNEALKVDETKSEGENSEAIKTDSNLEKQNSFKNLAQNLQSNLILQNNLANTNEEALKSESVENKIKNDPSMGERLIHDANFMDSKTEFAPAEIVDALKESENKTVSSQDYPNQMPLSELDTSLSSTAPIPETKIISSEGENKQVNAMTDNVEKISSQRNVSDKNYVPNEYKDNNETDKIEKNQIVQQKTHKVLYVKEQPNIPTVETQTSDKLMNIKPSNVSFALHQNDIQNIPETSDKDYLKEQSKSNENVPEITQKKSHESVEIKAPDQNISEQNPECTEKSNSSTVSEILDSSSQVSGSNNTSKNENHANSVTIENSQPTPGSSDDTLSNDATNIDKNNKQISEVHKGSLTPSTSDKTTKLKSSKTGKLKKLQLHNKESKDSPTENEFKSSIKPETPVKSVEPTSSTSLENNSNTENSSDAASFLKSVLPSPFKCKSLNENSTKKQQVNDKTDSKEMKSEIQVTSETKNLLSETNGKALPNQLDSMTTKDELQSSSTTPDLKNVASISTESKQNTEISDEPQTSISSNVIPSTSTELPKLLESSINSESDTKSSVIDEASLSSTSGQVIDETPKVETNHKLLSEITENKDSTENDIPSTSGPISNVESIAAHSLDIPNIATSGSSVETKQMPESSTTPVMPEQSKQHSQISNNTVSDIMPSTEENEVSSSGAEETSQNVIDEQSENDNSTLQTVDSDDTDIQYSDDSRTNSVTPPSPVDALRSRFEGLSGGISIRGPGRPQSPFRRMSFNSTKQVIALERIRDTSAEKPWYHKKSVDSVKTVIPKRTIKQQLEMERKVRKMVSDRKVRTYRKAEIVVQLMDLNFEEEEAILAASECSTLEQAISYLQQECQLCAGHFSVSQIVSMTHCEHRACRDCIRAYFTVQIRDRTILDLLCPFCNEPDITDEDVAQDYFNHLDIMLKKLVDVEIHELFQRKLRDRVLMKDPNFRWCSQCSSGFIAMPNLKRLVCPDCNAVTCASCRRLWERDHQGITCEAFAALKDASDPEAQAAGLAKMLTEDGIECPCCHFKYALAKGGCMHFRCIQCQHDFCSGCSRPFKMGQKCGVSEFCAKLGLHAHHPRNCLFYLRDKEPEDLQKLLDLSGVKYDRDPPESRDPQSTCHVMEQKETADGMVDDYCGKDVENGFAGLCRVHYVEYLGQLVNKHRVDPIQIFDNDDLELVLRRASIRLPPKRYRESDFEYREKLVNLIQEELPLDKMDGS